MLAKGPRDAPRGPVALGVVQDLVNYRRLRPSQLSLRGARDAQTHAPLNASLGLRRHHVEVVAGPIELVIRDDAHVGQNENRAPILAPGICELGVATPQQWDWKQ